MLVFWETLGRNPSGRLQGARVAGELVVFLDGFCQPVQGLFTDEGAGHTDGAGHGLGAGTAVTDDGQAL